MFFEVSVAIKNFNQVFGQIILYKMAVRSRHFKNLIHHRTLTIYEPSECWEIIENANISTVF